ncbi:N-acetyl-gamma-glutamyl-phosphate reductase [Pelagibacterales bacterium]|nr:N-acetyl-gamma-glutamyl-phosphate reductase [Pelagibacterales bacterium]
MSNFINISILGASGYVGSEMIHLCLKHPNIKIQSLSANETAGEHVSKAIPGLRDSLDLIFSKLDEIDFSNIDFIFSCLPHSELQASLHKIPDTIKIIDLSADFRLKKSDDYEKWYDFKHAHPDKLSEFVYGLTEFNRDKIKSAKYIANPGCYPTSILMPLIPLLKNKIIDGNNIIIDAKSGYSGAGKSKKTENIFAEVNENIKSYGIGDHRHIAEINQELSLANEDSIRVFFAANLIPVNRGILSNIYLNIDANKQSEIHECLKKAFANENFISLLPLNEVPSTREVVGSNRVSIGVKRGYKDDLLCIVSVIDNLLKGAAGQAMQNFNLMNNFNETTALTYNANIL